MRGIRGSPDTMFTRIITLVMVFALIAAVPRVTKASGWETAGPHLKQMHLSHGDSPVQVMSFMLTASPAFEHMGFASSGPPVLSTLLISARTNFDPVPIHLGWSPIEASLLIRYNFKKSARERSTPARLVGSASGRRLDRR